MNLKSWLADPNRSYDDGVELLRAIRHPKLSFFVNAKPQKPGPDSYHFRLMVSFLQNASRKLAQRKDETTDIPVIKVIDLSPKGPASPTGKGKTPPKASKTSPGKGKDSFRIADLDLIDIRQLPENLKTDYKNIKVLFSEIGRKHAEMKAAKSDKQRKALLEDLTSMEAQRLAMWKGINEWYDANKGKAADNAENDEKKIAEEAAKRAVARVKRMDTLKINIARANKEIKSGKISEAKVKSRKEKIVAWEKELSDLENEK